MIPVQGLPGYAIGAVLTIFLLVCVTCAGVCVGIYPYIITVLAFPRGLTGHTPIKNTIPSINLPHDESTDMESGTATFSTDRLINYKVTTEIGTIGLCKYAHIAPDEIQIDPTEYSEKVFVVVLSNNQDLSSVIESFSKTANVVQPQRIIILQHPDFSCMDNDSALNRWMFVLRNYTESFIKKQLIDCLKTVMERFEIPWYSVYLCAIGLGSSFGLWIREEIARAYSEIRPILLISPCLGFISIPNPSMFDNCPVIITRLFDCGNLLDAWKSQTFEGGISIILLEGTPYSFCENSTAPRITYSSQSKTWNLIRNRKNAPLIDCITIVCRQNCQDDFETYMTAALRKFLTDGNITSIASIPRWQGDIMVNK